MRISAALGARAGISPNFVIPKHQRERSEMMMNDGETGMVESDSLFGFTVSELTTQRRASLME